MTSVSETVRQLAPHWAVMFVAMFVALAAVERAGGGVGLAVSTVIVLAIAFGYPFVVRALGVAPPVWRR